MPRPPIKPLPQRPCDELDEALLPAGDAERFRSLWEETLADLRRALDGHRQKQESLLAVFFATPGGVASPSGSIPASPQAEPPPTRSSPKLQASAPRRPECMKSEDAPSPIGSYEAKRPWVVVVADDCTAEDSTPNRSASMLSSMTTKRRLEDMTMHREHIKNRREEVEAALEELEKRGKDRTRVEWARTRYLQALRWWLSVEEPERTGLLARITMSLAWEVFVSVLILCNSFFMTIMIDHSIYAQLFPEAEAENLDFMFAFEASFLAVFTLELVMRLLVHRQYFFISDGAGWNNFDFIILLLSVSDLVSQKLSLPTSGNATFVRSIRVLRLVRSLRVVRIVKHANALRRMLLSLMGSLVPLFWCLVLLWSVFYLFSLATVQGVSNYLMSNPENDPQWRAELIDRFGSVSQTMITYYKATCGGTGWGVHFDVLKKTGAMNAIMYLGAVAFTQIAVLNIMTGVFVENSFKNAQPDRHTMALEQRRAHIKEANELHEILKSVDTDGTGNISEDEFIHLSKDPRLNSILEVMGLDIKDAHLLHSMLRKADGSEEVNMDFLVHSLIKMKGPAMSVDLQALAYKTDLLHERIEAMTVSRQKRRGGQAPKPARSRE